MRPKGVLVPTLGVLVLGLAFASCASSTVPLSPSPSVAVATTAPGPSIPSPVASPTPTPVPEQQFSTVVFVSEHVGWVATFDGRIFRTTDAGWREARVPGALFLSGLDFVDTAVGWTIAVSGDRVCGAPATRQDLECLATVLRTEDGGESWTPSGTFQSHQTRIPLHDLRAVSGETFWAIHSLDCQQPGSCPDEVVITEDRGQHWRTALAGLKVLALEAVSASEAWAAVSALATSAGAYELRHTTDGGRSWHATLSSMRFLYASRSASSLWILERDGAYCTASDCSEYTLRTSNDAGETWTAIGNPKRSATCTGGLLGQPSFSGSDLKAGVIPISVAGGAGFSTGGLLETRDGGLTWSCSTTPSNVTVARAVMGIIVALSNDRATNTDRMWIRSRDGAWRTVLP